MIELLSYFVSGAQTNTRAPQPQSSRRKPRLKTMKQELEKKDQRPKTKDQNLFQDSHLPLQSH
jgi:hypothetical protein